MLSCCFRNTNNNNKKTKKQEEVKSSLLQQYDSEPQRPRQSSSRRSSNEMGNIKTVHSATLKCPQEKHPPSRIEKRLLKQRSQDSLPSRDLVPVSPPVSSPTHPQYSVQHKFRKTSSKNQLRERPQSQSLPSPPATPKLEIGKKKIFNWSASVIISMCRIITCFKSFFQLSSCEIKGNSNRIQESSC